VSGAVPAEVRHFIQSHFTLTLATSDGASPWAAALFYVSDREFNLYFVSDPDTRHVRDGLATGRVAVAIHGAHQPWATIAGVQMEARLEQVEESDRARVEALYFDRFRDVAMAIRAPAGAGASRLAEKFRASRFYRVVPVRLRHIDNSLGFAAPREFVF
jgi:uncharacterized protein YhbP (UPF0306 family)